MLQTRTNIAPPRAAGRKVMGTLRGGLLRLWGAVETWLWRTRRRRAPNRLDDGLRADRSEGQKLTPNSIAAAILNGEPALRNQVIHSHQQGKTEHAAIR